MVRWLAWLDEKIRKGHEVDEHESGRRLTMFRKEVEGFMGLAYETISASGSNACEFKYYCSREAALKFLSFHISHASLRAFAGPTGHH